MSEFDLSSRVRRRDDQLVTRTIVEERIIVPIRGHLADMQAIFALNEVADFIWLQLDGTKNLGQIVDAVVQEFSVTPEQAERDLRLFMEELLKESLVTVE